MRDLELTNKKDGLCYYSRMPKNMSLDLCLHVSAGAILSMNV